MVAEILHEKMDVAALEGVPGNTEEA